MTSALRILSIIPPKTQLNTPYPSTAYLTGFLRSRGFHAEQMDLSIGLALRLLSIDGLHDIHQQIKSLSRKQHTAAMRFFADHFERSPNNCLYSDRCVGSTRALR